jgi:prepilin-type N-terminal cleavage/methylation domain-containing protein
MMLEVQQSLPAGTNNTKGYSLFEILVVMSLLVILMVVTTQTLGTSLKNVRKSEAITKVRSEVDRAVAVMERHLHNARGVVCAGDSRSVSYFDPDQNPGEFSCESNHIASSSARLTSSEIEVTNCTFVCLPETGRTPPSVGISVSARDADSAGVEGAEVSTAVTIYLRTY